jgi:hypothetical protein
MISFTSILLFSFVLFDALADDSFAALSSAPTSNLDFRIVGGESTEPGEYPFFGEFYLYFVLIFAELVANSLLLLKQCNGRVAALPLYGGIFFSQQHM